MTINEGLWTLILLFIFGEKNTFYYLTTVKKTFFRCCCTYKNDSPYPTISSGEMISMVLYLSKSICTQQIKFHLCFTKNIDTYYKKDKRQGPKFWFVYHINSKGVGGNQRSLLLFIFYYWYYYWYFIYIMYITVVST